MRHGHTADRSALDPAERAANGDVAPARAPREAPDARDCVVAGIDFGSASLAAARWATRHLARPGAAVLAHVVPGEASDGGASALLRLRPALVGGLGGLAAMLRLPNARSVVRAGSPSAALAALAASEGARLLVLGRRRDAARLRTGEPNVIERVARRAPCAVLVVPEGTEGPVGHVIAAVDDGPWAERVVDAALRLARARGAALTIAHVLPPSFGSYDRLARLRRPEADGGASDDDVVGPARRDAAYARLAWLARGAGAEVACHVTVVVGDAAREIGALASGGASVVVVGKRGEHDAPAGSLGSVARELLARCPAPVIAVDCALDPAA